MIVLFEDMEENSCLQHGDAETNPQSRKQEIQEMLPMDGKASWLACVCASLASFVCVGTCYIYGIFFPAILAEFNVGKAKAALPGSFSIAFLTILCPVAAFFFNRYGCRIVLPCGGLISALGLLGSAFAPNIYVLSFTYGLLVAWGSCLIYMAGFLMVPLYFDKYCSTATGMVSAGPGAGVLIMGPLAQSLIESMGWRKAMKILAAINFSTSILGCVISRKSTNIGNNQRIKLFSSLINYLLSLKNPLLIFAIVINTLMYFGHFMPLVHLLKFADEIGVSTHASSWMYPITGIISTVCRVLTGKVGDTGRVSFYTMFQCGLMLMAIAQFLMPLATNVGHLYGYAVTQGICEAMYFTSAYCLAMSADPKQGLAWLMFFGAIPIFVSAPIAGLIADSSGSYYLVFNTSGCFLVFTSLVTFLRNCLPQLSIKTENYYQEELVESSKMPCSTVERETVL